MSEHTLHHLTWISVVRVKSSVSAKCLTIFLWVCGLCHISSTTTVCHGNTSPSIWCHCMNSVILTCRTPLVCQSMWDPVGNCLMISRIHKITLTIITLIFNSTQREQTVGHPVHTYNILDSCNILQIIDNVTLSWSWHVCCSLPANACTSYLPGWLYSSPQVSTSAFTKSKDTAVPSTLLWECHKQVVVAHTPYFTYCEEIMPFTILFKWIVFANHKHCASFEVFTLLWIRSLFLFGVQCCVTG